MRLADKRAARRQDVIDDGKRKAPAKDPKVTPAQNGEPQPRTEQERKRDRVS